MFVAEFVYWHLFVHTCCIGSRFLKASLVGLESMSANERMDVRRQKGSAGHPTFAIAGRTSMWAVGLWLWWRDFGGTNSKCCLLDFYKGTSSF